MITLIELGLKLKDFADRIQFNFLSTITANPEDQLKRPMADLIEGLIEGQISTRTEAQVEGLGARPDLGVARNNLLCGHIELKAPGVTIKKFTGDNKIQFDKFMALPNLIYTNGSEWALYKNGELQGSFISFAGDVSKEGAKAISDKEIEQLYTVLINFINWRPIVPKSPKELAKILAPLCRLLRSDVEQATTKESSTIHYLYKDWQRLFFPEANIDQFADAYAQTLTYALLLARLSGAEIIKPEEAAVCLDAGHSLLAQTLRLLGQEEARKEMETPIDVLQRIIEAVDPVALSAKGDPWLYFYEDFLSAYDSKLRKDYGVYYTPIEVVECQVKLCAQLLKGEFNKALGFADEGVTFLDPATGTGAYPLTAIQHGLNDAETRFGVGIIAAVASQMAENFHAFEYMVGPYAVSHMRITKLLQDAGATFPKNGIKVFLTDTLEDPDADSPRFSFAEKTMAEEHIKAQAIKRDTRILVCMGNPPYDREQREDEEKKNIKRKGGWVRFGSDHGNTSKTEGILKDFIENTPGIHVKNLYNDYVYFWRWALWKLYENKNSAGPGIISFITASSYLRGPGFVSMRKKIREAFDDMWIIDLEGDNLGARKTENVFNIQIPVAIAIGIRKDKANISIPAKIKYSKITGTREEKLATLTKINSFDDLDWHSCFQEWEKPMLPKGEGDYFSWPLLTDIFPWQHSGVQFKRKWPISFQKEILEKRWKTLLSESALKRKNLFGKEGDRIITKDYPGNGAIVTGGKKISSLLSNSPMPAIQRYSYRSLDRQYCIPDNRLASRARPDLWNIISDRQIFISSIFSKVLGAGAGLMATCFVPDLDFFCGRGGKDIIPLWKDNKSTHANITKKLLDHLSDNIKINVTPEQLFQYTYAILANPSYTNKFSEELTEPGPRLPITKNSTLFFKLSQIGERLIYLHTFGERFFEGGGNKEKIPPGSARCLVAIQTSFKDYPEGYSYDEDSLTLRVGKGEFKPVSKAVYEFSISGWEVVKKWLGYRMKEGAGKDSSPLDELRPERWTAQMTQELIELLWVLEHTLNIYPRLEGLLYEVINSDCFAEIELPKPIEAERNSLKSQGELI